YAAQRQLRLQRRPDPAGRHGLGAAGGAVAGPGACRMIGVAEAFPASYAEGRAKFLAACVAAGLPVQTHPLALPGAGGEALAMDVAREGPADAERLLVVTSACHGVEGHCGSGVQVFALHDDEWRDKARAAGVAVLYVH